MEEIVANLRAENEQERISVFKLIDICKLYSDRLNEFGVVLENRVNSTHLKDNILVSCPMLHAYNKGRDVFIAFKDDIGEFLQSYTEDSGKEGMYLAKAAAIIRKGILGSKVEFGGIFEKDCQLKSLPKTLVSFVNMVLCDSKLKDSDSLVSAHQPSLSISRLILFNCYKRQ